MWCYFMLRDFSNEFYISQSYSSAYLFSGHHPQNQNSQNMSNKGCTFQVDTWGVYMGWYQCLRDLVTKLDTPQFALYFDILCALSTFCYVLFWKNVENY